MNAKETKPKPQAPTRRIDRGPDRGDPVRLGPAGGGPGGLGRARRQRRADRPLERGARGRRRLARRGEQAALGRRRRAAPELRVADDPGGRAALAPDRRGRARGRAAAAWSRPCWASSWSARARPSGRARRRPATSCARCWTARSPTAATSRRRAAELGADFSERRRRADRPGAPARRAERGVALARADDRAARGARGQPGALAAEGEHPGEGAEIVAIVPTDEDERLAQGRAGAGRRARAGADRVRGHGLAQPPRRRPGGPLPRRAGGAPGRQRRRGRGPDGSSRSRTPAPTACCCRR